MNQRYRYLASISLFLLCVTSTPRSAPAGDDWQPIAPEDLALKDNPASPGAHAMILYRESMVDAVQSSVSEYVRIKIFTEQGRKEANVEIPFVKGADDIQDVRARTIRPDGSVLNYEGKPFEKMVVKVSGYKVLAKTFTLPDVQPDASSSIGTGTNPIRGSTTASNGRCTGICLRGWRVSRSSLTSGAGRRC
jgi:hypothetical protein